MPADFPYRSRNLLVRAVPAADTSRWVVTFDHVGSGPLDETRPGFGEVFLASRGVSVVSVLARGDHWYQYRDTVRALAAVRRRVGGAERVIAYGSSMGAYAAIRFADRVGARAVLALSPQYSIDPARVPWEWRWQVTARALRFRRALDGPIRCRARVVAVADPHGLDGRHVRRIAGEVPRLDFVQLPYTAHPVTTFLGSVGLLGEAVLALLDDRLDPAAFEAAAERRRHGDPIYLGELARLQPAWRPRLGVRLAEAAVAGAPDSPVPVHSLALRLAMAGRTDEAVTAHLRAGVLSGGPPAFVLPYADTLIRAERWADALAVTADLLARFPDDAAVHSYHGKVLWQLGHRRDGLRHAREALRREPGNRHFRVVLSRWRRAWRREGWGRLWARARATLGGAAR